MSGDSASEWQPPVSPVHRTTRSTWQGCASGKGLCKLLSRVLAQKPCTCLHDCGLGHLGKVIGEETRMLVAAWGSVPEQASRGVRKLTQVCVPFGKCKCFLATIGLRCRQFCHRQESLSPQPRLVQSPLSPGHTERPDGRGCRLDSWRPSAANIQTPVAQNLTSSV